MREQYLSLLADINDGALTDDQVRMKRDELSAKLASIYTDAPDTTGQDYAAAQKALKVDEEMTFSVNEIDVMLPPRLRKHNNPS